MLNETYRISFGTVYRILVENDIFDVRFAVTDFLVKTLQKLAWVILETEIKYEKDKK